MIHIVNLQDPESALVYRLLVLNVCWEVPLWCKLGSEKMQSEVKADEKWKLKLKISNA